MAFRTVCHGAFSAFRRGNGFPFNACQERWTEGIAFSMELSGQYVFDQDVFHVPTAGEVGVFQLWLLHQRRRCGGSDMDDHTENVRDDYGMADR